MDGTQLTAILTHIGSARISTYRAACDGSDGSAVALYEWNLRLGAAFQEILMVFEVGLRNSIDAQLCSWNKHQSGNTRNQGRQFTGDWIANPATPLHGMMRDAIVEATQQANAAAGRRLPTHPRFGATPTHDDVLAQISFGKWAALMPYTSRGHKNGRKHVGLWKEALVDAFPHAPSGDKGMRDVSSKLHRLHHLRNRIVHGENILSVVPEHRLVDALMLSQHIDPLFGDWIMKLNRVRTIVRERHP